MQYGIDVKVFWMKRGKMKLRLYKEIVKKKD